jgi:hypothetical protein
LPPNLAAAVSTTSHSAQFVGEGETAREREEEHPKKRTRPSTRVI